jgi:hypothetical protein
MDEVTVYDELDYKSTYNVFKHTNVCPSAIRAGIWKLCSDQEKIVFPEIVK